MTLLFRTSLVLTLALSQIVAAGCGESDKERWDEFWKDGRDAFSIGRRAGDMEDWTIECNEFTGPSHVDTADTLTTALKRVSGLKSDQVRVRHDEEKSRIYYGRYRLRYVEAKGDSDTRTSGDVVIELSPEIRADLDFIRKLAMGDQYPFISARPAPVPQETLGPPEWDLRNVQGEYSLHVGVTYATPTLHDYQAAAVEWVRDLRRRGYDAYFCHDPDRAQTSICVGVFGEDALVDTGDGRSGYSPAVRQLREKEELMYNLENGHIVNRIATDETGKRVSMPNLSFLVEIPKKGDAAPDGGLIRR